MRSTAASTAALLVVALLAGCGSSGNSSSEVRHAIAQLSSTIQAYNRAPQGDVLATAAGCQKAHAALSRDSTLLNPSSGSDALDTDLRNAYQGALAGFADCTAAAPYDYHRMLQAQAELNAANAWLARARTVS